MKALLREMCESDGPIRRKIKEGLVTKVQGDIDDLISRVDVKKWHGADRTVRERIGRQVGTLLAENIEYFHNLTSDAIDEYIIARLGEEVEIDQESGC